MTAAEDGRPDPGLVTGLDDLGQHLDRLRRRAARGSGKQRVSLDALARQLDVPRSTLHVYVTGRTLPPAEVLDRIVIALGATPQEQRAWADAWYRVGADRPPSGRENQSTAIAEPPAAPARPRQLPPNRTLIGRAKQIAALAEALTPPVDAPVTTLVYGMPGVGKTALAVHVATAVSASYPDGQLYVDLAGADRNPRAAASVLAQFLRALGADTTSIPDELAELTSAFRTWTAELRLLVLLDNAVGESQVDTLLPSAPGCASIITSRSALAGLDLDQRVRVAPLAAADAYQVLALGAGVERLSAEPHAAQRIVQACGGLPLALRIAAARLSTLPQLRVLDMADRMASDSARLDQLATPGRSVAASLGTGFRLLDPEPQRALSQVARHGNSTFASWLVAPLTGLSLDRVDAITDDLVAASMLETATEPPIAPRYRLHDLVRAHAAGVESRPGDPEGLRRTVAWSVTLAAAACGAVTGRDVARQLGADFGAQPDARLIHRVRADPVAWCAAESTTLLASIDRGLELGMTRAAAALLTGLGHFLVRADDLDAYLNAARRCLESAQQDPVVLARSILAQAEVMLQRSDYPGAKQLLHQIVDQLDEVPPMIAADVWRQLGSARTFCNDSAGALTAHQHALSIAESIDDRWSQAECHRGLAVVLRDDDGARAVQHGERALLLADAVGDWRIRVMARFGLGRLALRTGEAARAVGLAEDAWQLASRLGDRVADAWCSLLRSDARRAAGDLGPARDAAERALELGRDLRRPDVQAAALGALAKLDADLGDTAAAESRTIAARRLHRVFDSPRERRALERTDDAVVPGA